MTLNELRLQQLLQPFQNQNTGITNTTAASPFINTEDILNQYNIPNLRNQDLVNQLIQENMQKNITSDFINAPQYYDEIITDEEEQYPYLGYNNMGYQTPRTIADQNRILGQTFTQQQPNFFQRIFNKASDIYGSGRNLIGTGIGSLISLASGIPGIGLLTGLINPNPQSAIDTRRLQQAGYGTQLQDIYGPGGIMQNYNMISAFGRGPLESIINRRNKAKSEAIRNKLNQAITQLGGSTDTNLSTYRASRPASERRSTGPAGGGRDNTGGDVGSRGAADSFSNRSGMGRTGY